MKRITYLLMTFVLLISIAGCAKPQSKTATPKDAPIADAPAKEEPAKDRQPKKNEDKQEEKAVSVEKLTFVLDWVPNTNHTGLFAAKENGYFAEEGLEVDIVQPAEDSSSAIVGSGKAELGVYFQPNMVKRLNKGTPITAVAAILQDNTAGIMSLEESGIKSPKDLSGKKYSTWEDPVDDATIQHIVNKDGGDWSKVELVPGESTDATTSLRLKLFDAIFVYHGWDYIHSQTQNVKTNFFLLKDFEPAFNYYSPVIIANNDFLKNKPEVAKRALRALKKGYEFAAAKPEEAAEILIKNAPEGDHDLIRASQKYVSTQYIADSASWGVIDRDRWNNFFAWVYEMKLSEKDLKDLGFTNDFLE